MEIKSLNTDGSHICLLQRDGVEPGLLWEMVLQTQTAGS